jgi:putative ABC transport system substrate-binding protein
MSLRRREFICGLGGSVVWPVAGSGQQRAMPVIGYLHQSQPEPYAYQVEAFRKGLSEMGFIEGRNVAFEFRWAENDLDRLPNFAADLVRRRVDLIAAPGGPSAALAAKAATSAIPIVFSTGVDPVQLGLVDSLNRPGGNATGVTDMHVELVPKRLGILHELVPGAARFAVLVNPKSPYADIVTAEARTAAAAIRGQIEIVHASTSREIDLAFASIPQMRADAMLITPDTLFNSRRVQLVTLAVRYSVPVMYQGREYTDVGGLMSYGTNVRDRNRQIGIYAGRILKGEKPADLPVMRPVKFEFVFNLQTARTLGIAVPPTLLALADEVIE